MSLPITAQYASRPRQLEGSETLIKQPANRYDQPSPLWTLYQSAQAIQNLSRTKLWQTANGGLDRSPFLRPSNPIPELQLLETKTYK